MKRKLKICVSGGSAGSNAEKAAELARKIGEEIAKRGCILVSGATSGVPYEAAVAAKKAGGVNIGFSPAGSREEHIKKYHLPAEDSVYDHLVYTEMGYTGRNLLMVRSSDAVIIIDGRIGTLNEFTVAFEENQIVGVLEGSGGIADEIRHLLKVAKKGNRKVIFDNDPVRLIEKIITKIKEEEKI